jgi:hypothetical protein
VNGKNTLELTMLLGLAFLQRKFACAWNDQMRFASSILRLNNYVLIYSPDYFLFTTIVTLESILKLRVIRQTANARQRKMLWYQAIKSKWTCCFKIEIRNYSFDTRKKIWNENEKMLPRKFEPAVCRSRKREA